MFLRLAIAAVLFAGLTGLTPDQAAASVPTARVATETILPILTRYLRALDAVYTTTGDELAARRAKTLLPRDARYALGLRRALSASNLAVASASERISGLTVTERQGGGATITAVVDHSYRLVTARTRVPETTWQEAMPTQATIDRTASGYEVTEVEQQTATNAGPLRSDDDAVRGQPETLDDLDAADRVQVPAGTRSYPTSDSCGASPPDYCYFRSDAIGYVLAHACKTCHDPDWHYFRNEDCTNFMSAALYLRGNWRQQDYPTDYSTSWWWRSPTDHSRTWTVANTFYWYLAQRSRAVHARSLSQLIVGDLLQADWTGDGVMDHTAMVTKEDGTGLYLSYHSNDTRNKPWAAFTYGEPDAKYYGWNLQHVYDNRI